jgi:hypothetical protein
MRPLTDAKRLSACLVALRVLDRDVYIGPAELRRLLDSTARRINGLADVQVSHAQNPRRLSRLRVFS